MESRNNKYAAKRINPGQYEYRGYNIEKMEAGHWNIGPVGEYFSDAAQALWEAKLIVDSYHGE